MTIGTFLVLQNAQPGRDQDHTDWYLSDHLADVSEVPGMVRGTYATAAPGFDKPDWLHLGYYLIDGEPGPVFEEVLRRSFSGAWNLADTLDFRGMMRSIGVQRGGFARHGAQQAVGDGVAVLLVSPREANAAALLEWSRGSAFVDETTLPGVTAVRLFEPALSVGVGSSKCSFNVAEKFVFEKLFRDRGTAHRDKVTLSPVAGIVYGFCDQFLTGSGLSRHQHVDLVRSNDVDLLQDVEHYDGSRDDLGI